MERRVIIAGCGQMAHRWLESLAAPELAGRLAVVALVDPALEAAEKMKADFGRGEASVYGDLQTALSNAEPDIVFDIAIPATRHDIVRNALDRGCHVLTEKPMATSMADAREINALARAKGKIHAVTQNRRFRAGIRRVRALVESGVLGRITAVHSDFFLAPHFGGFRDVMDHVLLLDMAVHTFDAARFISGEEPLTVYCHETNPEGSWYRHGAAANAIFELTNGVVFTYRGSWCAEGSSTSWDASWRITGTRGSLLWDGEDTFTAKVVDGEDGFLRSLREVEVPMPPDGRRVLDHVSVICDFLDALDENRLPETAGGDNIRTLAMVFGAIDSARTGRKIALEPWGA